MIKAHLTLPVATIALLVGACTEHVAPTVKATAVQQTQCAVASGDVRVLQHTTVLDAGPLYSHVITGKNGSEDRVTGAKLLVRPPDGISAEQLERMLQCHSAQVLLGQVDTSRFADDPYWLPNAWLDIDVKPDHGNFEVVLRADSVPDGLNVLHRATAFAEAHRAPSTP